MPWTRRIPFQVDVAGIIEIMGTSLYSRVDTPIRELIQNAHDAIVRRRKTDLSFRGRIDIEQDAAGGRLLVHDDGVGLNAEEAERYLGTLGAGITGMIKRRLHDGTDALPAETGAGSDELIGQFGVGLFSAFMLASTLVVESRRVDAEEGVRWEAGAGTDVVLSSFDRPTPGTTVILNLKPDRLALAENPDLLETAVKEYAEYLPVPIFLNRAAARLNLINASWFDPTPDREALELELENEFGETPLDLIQVRKEKPVMIAGALYVTPKRTPGFAGTPVVTATVRRMVISRRIQGLLPEWASFLRGVLELNDCSPTASREDLVRDAAFERVRNTLEDSLLAHFEGLATGDPARLRSVLNWHRYAFAGAALDHPRLRQLLRSSYLWPTSAGELSFDDIVARSAANPLTESDAERVLWYNVDRRQERWLSGLFAGCDAVCVHALRSFEESLLAAFTADVIAGGTAADLRLASPGSANFTATVLGAQESEDAPPVWQEFLNPTGARVLCGEFKSEQPVFAFLNERAELARSFEDLKKQDVIPSGFQRLIDRHFESTPVGRNEVLLNRSHELIRAALRGSVASPLASVLRLLVLQALEVAGAVLPAEARRLQFDDLGWIAETLRAKKS